MKQIELKSFPTTQSGLTPEQAEADRLDYLSSLRQVIRAPLNAGAGIDMEEMEKGLRLLRALEGLKTGGILKLEDADHAHLCDKIRAARWAAVDERIMRFVKDVLNAVEYHEAEYHEVEDIPNAVAGRVDGHSDELLRGREPRSASVGR